MMRDLEPCEICHEDFEPEELVEFGGMQLCPECLDASTLVCERCGARIFQEDNARDDEITLCQACFENHYVRCSCCDRIVRETDAYYGDDDTLLCYDCNRERSSRYAVQPYGYKPTPIFYGEGALHLGVELEMDNGGESDAKAKTLMEIANDGDERVCIKHDGSLDDGFEVVTHPITLDYHLHHMPWAEMLEKFSGNGV